MTILKFKKEKAALTNKSISKLTSHISDLTTTYKNVLYSSDCKTLIHCPKTFNGHFDVPQGVEIIGIEAFAGCKGLLSISSPDSMQKISMLAFADCENLHDIILKSTQTIQLSDDSFRGVDKSKCIVHTPVIATNNYLKDNHWIQFKNIVAVQNTIIIKQENKKLAI
jgi:hypothetical protein